MESGRYVYTHLNSVSVSAVIAHERSRPPSKNVSPSIECTCIVCTFTTAHGNARAHYHAKYSIKTPRSDRGRWKFNSRRQPGISGPRRAGKVAELNFERPSMYKTFQDADIHACHIRSRRGIEYFQENAETTGRALGNLSISNSV